MPGSISLEESIFFSAVQIPALIAITGKARIYKPEPGSFDVSIRAEEVNSQEFIKLLRVSIIERLKSLDFDPKNNAGSKTDQKELVLELLREMGGYRGIDYADFVDKAFSNGITYQFIE